MTYFKYSFFTPQQTKQFLIGVNVIIACLGVLHWGYCGLMGRILSFYKDPKYGLYGSYEQMKSLYNSPIAYYSISGIQQILTSVAVILVVLNHIGRTNRSLWMKVIFGLLMFNFAFNFVIAVSASMNCTYYSQLFKQYYDDWDTYLKGNLRDFVLVMRDFMNFSIAMAVITWILTLPLIIATVIGFLSQAFKEVDERIANQSTDTILPPNSQNKV